MLNPRQTVAFCLAALLLQGCGGGSSSTGVTTGALTGTVSLTGSAIAAPTTTDRNTGATEFGDAAATANPILEFDLENDQLTQIRVRDSEVDIVLDLTDPDTLFADLPYGLAIATADFSTVAVFGFDPRNTFEHHHSVRG